MLIQKIIACDRVQYYDFISLVKKQDELLKLLPLNQRRKAFKMIREYIPVQYSKYQINDLKKELIESLIAPTEIVKKPPVKRKKPIIKKPIVVRSKITDEQIMEAVKEGLRPVQICKKYDISSSTLVKRMQKLKKL